MEDTEEHIRAHINGIRTWVMLAKVRLEDGITSLALVNLRFASRIANHLIEDHKKERR